jgi:hypothetical protein
MVPKLLEVEDGQRVVDEVFRKIDLQVDPGWDTKCQDCR